MLIAYYDLGVLGGKVLIYEACSPYFHPVKTFLKLKCIFMACILRILLGAFILMCSVINWLEIRYGKVTSQWDIVRKIKVKMCDIFSIPPHDKVRGTFIMGRDDITKLKNLILSRRSSLTHVTSFTVTCAYAWTCLIKSEDVTGEEIDENGTEFFLCAADCRAQLNSPLPPNYFGNCLVGYTASTRHADLVENEGFTIGAEIIGEAIRKSHVSWLL